jgi:molybdopterin synthase catalytic subunit
MRTIRVQPENFDVSAECAALSADNDQVGAIVAFTGIVRSDEGLTSLTLQHYPGMTEREIADHVDEAERRWPLTGVIVIHRVGRLGPGEKIVLVATASDHRRAAFEAAEFLVDYLKTRAPFWKEERRGAETKWVEARESDRSAAARWNRA